MSLIMSPPILSSDLIIEILSWLPVKSLVRFTCVSKFLKSLIFDPTFTKLHLQRSPKNTHALITLLCDPQNYSKETWAATPFSVRDLLEHSSSLVNKDECYVYDDYTYSHTIGSTNGLVCLIRIKGFIGNREICIKFWNPTLRLRSKKSPTLTVLPPNRSMSWKIHLGFGYDDSSDTYKVVAVFWDRTTQKWEGRVHYMGDNCWRKTLACPDYPIILESSHFGSFVNGSVNWLASHKLNCHRHKQVVIFSLDMRNETCKYMLLPNGFVKVPKPSLTVLRGCLCLYYDYMETHFVLWEMREFGVQESWTRLVNVSYVHLYDLYDSYFVATSPLLPVCLSENGDDILLASTYISYSIVTMYNRRDDRVEHIEVCSDIWYCQRTYAKLGFASSSST